MKSMDGLVRSLGRLAAVAAVALVLAGSAATPAEARPRSGAVAGANADIGYCFRTGGEASALDLGGSIMVSCVYGNGDYWELDNPYDD